MDLSRKNSPMRASNVKPNTIHPTCPTMSIIKPTIPNTIMKELTKKGRI